MTVMNNASQEESHRRSTDNRRLGWSIAAVALAIFLIVLFLKS